MGGELCHQTLDLVKGAFCHMFLLPKDSVYCTTRSTPPRGLPLCALEAERCGSAAPGSGSAADAVRRRLQPLVGLGMAQTPLGTCSLRWPCFPLLGVMPCPRAHDRPLHSR